MRGVKMKTLVQEIEEMRLRMNDRAKNETSLVTALDDTLKGADSKLLDNVRNLVSEHEARRAAISKELQVIASRLGALPEARNPFGPISDAMPQLKAIEAAGQNQPAYGHGDRRAPASSMAEELTKHLAARTTAR
jgi:hypothetical protein